MKQPLQIIFRNLHHSNNVENLVRNKVDWLESYCNNIIKCRVTIEVPHRHHKHGNLYLIRLHITVPNKEIIVNKEQIKNPQYKDIHTALHDAFDTAKRQLKDYANEKHEYTPK